jgi:aldehyde dehydrogenase (NAD+)
MKDTKGSYVNGKWRMEGSDHPIINPANKTKIAQVKWATTSVCEDAIKASNAEFNAANFRHQPARQRSRVLFEIANLIRDHLEEFAQIEALCNGKTLQEARLDDIPDCADVFDYYAGWTDKYYGDLCPVDHGFINYVMREPVGVCVLIVPWNFPLLMACWKIAPALAMGNSVIVKPSEFTPLSVVRLFELIDQKLDLPKGLLNLTIGAGEVGGYLCSSHNVHKVSFTGSTQTGKKIIEAASSSNLKNVTLELGGKSANIFFEDTPDPEKAFKQSFKAMFSHKGEKCSEPTRFFIHESLYELAQNVFVELGKKTVLGDPFDPNTTQGAQCHKDQYQKIMSYIEKGLAGQSRCLIGGKSDTKDGYFIAPTIFADVDPGEAIFQEEIFGPVLCISSFEDESLVIDHANATMYGLAAGLWTQDLSRAHRVAEKLDAGMVFINKYGCYDFSSPFGGFKQSGWGKEMGIHSLQSYTRMKSIWLKYI